MYQALYRKYRPRRFSEVTGQEHITGTLRRQITIGRLSHAYLFVGTRGTGKTTCAKLLSRAVNCLSPEDGEPCNKCASCTGIENGSILDVLELDAASNNGVDNVRALREEAIYSPASVKMRVYIIDEVHMLSPAAFNALLKILEEPPEHLLFILATTELHKVPATILSRCQRFSFKRLSPLAIAARLQSVAESEGLALTADASAKIAALGDGSMRDALSLLDQCASDTTIDMRRVLDTLGLAGRQELISLSEAIAGRDMTAALGVMDGLYDDGRDMTALLSELASLMRDILVYKLSKDSPLLSGAFSGAELSALSAKLATERLFAFLNVIRDALFSLSRNSGAGSAKLSAEMCLIRMCDERLSEDVSTLVSRIARLEDNTQWTIDNRQSTIDNGQYTHSEPVKEPEEGNSQFSILDSQLSTTPQSTLQTPQSTLQTPPSTPGAPLSTPHTPHSHESGGFWHDILDLLKDAPMIYAVLSNDARIQAELQEGVLLIRAADGFTVKQIESKMFSEPLSKAAGKVLGREVVIRAEIGGGSAAEDTSGKLDRLSDFGIVKFEQY